MTFRYLALALLAGAQLQAGPLQLGRAAVTITPPAGAPMAGYYYNRAAEGVHDELYAKALVMEKDGVKAALVVCDLSGVSRPVVEEARRLIRERAGIPPERVMISATHTHTGPVLIGPNSRYNLEGEMARIARQYIADLPGRIADAAAKANAALAPARVSAAVGREEFVSFNRRFFMKDGTVGWNPGKLNPNIVKPAGPIDPDVTTVYFEDAARAPLATYVNFALHLDTVGGQQYSADYPYTLGKILGKVKGESMMTVFSIGAAGNLNHIDVNSRAPQKGHDEAARIGTVLAGEVIKTYTRLAPLEPARIAARSEILKLAPPALKPGELEKARQIAPKFGKPNAAPFMDLVWAFKVIDTAAREGQPVEAEVQVITLGDQVAWVALPGEIFTELGMAIKQSSAFPYTIITELANGSVGYVPDRDAYPQGAYEVVSARVAVGSGERMVESALRMLRELHQGR